MTDKSTKRTPALRFPEFTGEWEEKRLGEIVDINSGQSPTDLVSDIGEYPFFKVEQLNNSHKYLVDTPYWISQKHLLIHKGSIIFAKRGAAILLNRVRILAQDSFMDTNLMTLTISAGNSNEFIYYLLTNENLSRIADTTSIPQINNKHIIPYKVYLTYLEEQEKIADFLGAVDRRLELLGERREQLEEYKRGVMQQIFSQKIRFKDKNGNQFPEWEKKRLKEILHEHRIRNTNLQFEEVFSVAKEAGVVNQIEHLGRSYAAKDTSNYKVINPHDIAYTKSPTSDFPFGIIKQNKLDRSGIVSTLYAVFKPKNKYLGFILDAYFSSGIRTYNYLNPIVERGAKNTMNINNNTFLNGAKLSIPSSLAEQQKIADFLSAIDQKIEIAQSEIDNLEEYKKGLLQQMFV